MLGRWLLVPLLALVSLGTAQDLLRLAPDSSVVVLELAPDAGPPAGLVEAISALPWGEAADTLGRLALGLADATNGPGELDVVATLLGELGAECAPAADVLAGARVDDLLAEGVLVVSIAPFAPVPHVLALARAGDPARAAALQDALVACFGGTRLEQDGVALEVLFDGTEMPLIVARVGDVFVAATEPNLVRGVVRRAGGATEPSLADRPLGRAFARLTPGGIGFGLDLGAVGATVAALAGDLPSEAAPVVERAVAMLETLGVVAGRVGWEADGLRFESVHAWPPDAPDAPLAALLADPRRADRPAWLPAGAVAVSSTLVPLRGLVDYLDDWLVALEEPLGMRADVRGLAADLLGLDLDAALLSWIGETVHVIELAPLGTDLRGWVQGTPRIVAIPVLNEELARLGLAELGAGTVRLLTALAAMADDPMPMGTPPADPFADPFATGPSGDAGLDALFGPQSYVVTQETIDGHPVDRVRAGPTFDLGVALVDGHLVLATPFRAMRQLLATRAGGPDLRADPTWRAALDARPADARNAGWTDVPAYLRGLADVADLAAQPIASLLALGLTTDLFDRDPFGGFDDDWGAFDGGWGWSDDGLTPPSFGMLPWDVDLDTMLAVPLAVGSEVRGEFTPDATSNLFSLTGVAAGTVVEVEMTDPSGSVDTYLYVLDADTGELLFDNDDAPGTDRSFVAFEAEPGVSYQVLTTSFGGFDVGPYALGVRTRAAAEAAPEAAEAEAPAADDGVAVEPPTFAELLAVTDVLPRLLELLAERSGLAASTTTVDDGAAFTRTFVPLR